MKLVELLKFYTCLKVKFFRSSVKRHHQHNSPFEANEV